MFKFTKTLHESANGKLFVRYTPQLRGDGSFGPCCTGELSFAAWDVDVGAPADEHDAAKCLAIDNVRAVLARILDTTA